jgi:hypothetical protein
MIPHETKRANSAKAIVDLATKLDRAVETFLDSSIALGREQGLNGHGAPLSQGRLMNEVQSAILHLVPSAKLPGAKARETQSKFSRGLRLGDIELVKRL